MVSIPSSDPTHRMKISVTFAVSTLVPSLWSTPPMRNVYIPPPYQPEPIRLCRAWAASLLGEVRWAGSGGRHDAG
ncbi:uncharacterized protein EV420DRAFT_1543077 [Desarmillaria tabescens]|uniref:Uncharacterized protein n=1 Tax=Armillaria tabescens TaxID=1929756 RepID=A0AA39N5D8_ARMTA|nr:uncharacterized protein EV420DRAFT_1543077 [Desarmillaria tabescens]KAK0458552.1 hypothetical protein EV420DRAFT_1543077 [Desarmillaria tabescens]